MGNEASQGEAKFAVFDSDTPSQPLVSPGEKRHEYEFPARNDSDYYQAKLFQKEHTNLKKIFTKMHTFVDRIVECEHKPKYDWSGLDKKLITCLNDPYFDYMDQKNILGDYLSLLNAAGPMCRAYYKGLEAANLQSFTPWKLKNPNKTLISFLSCMREVILNYTDASFVFCERISDHGYLEFCVADLKEGSGLLDRLGENPQNHELTSLGTLYNCSRNAVIRQTLRSYNVGDILMPYLKAKSDKVRVLAIVCLANIIDEQQSKHIMADDNLLDFYINVLKSAMASKERRYAGMTVKEVVEGLTSLAKHDGNKSLLVVKNVLPVLKELLQGKDQREGLLAIRCIWELAFDPINKEKITKDVELMVILKYYDSNSTKHELMSREATRTLWTLNHVDMPRAKITGETSLGKEGHIMISYNWGDQAVLIQVKEHLSREGFSVWFDTEQMSGSILDAMSDAVEKARAVLICMSERYKDSRNCRLEAEYALVRKKLMVPLMMQRGYQPDGWLGILRGQKLYFDFSGKYPFEKKVNELTVELRRQITHDTSGDSKKTATDSDLNRKLKHKEKDEVSRKSVGATDARSRKSTVKPTSDTSRWTSKDVNNWLLQNGLEKYASLKSVTGEDLLFMKDRLQQTPEFFYNYMKDELKVRNVGDLRRFSEALKGLQ